MLAELVALTANIHRDPKKQPSAFSPDDFLPFKRETPRPRPMTPEETADYFERLFGLA